jgi:hypothetical protein
MKKTDPNYISWKGWFICMWYAIPVALFSGYATLVVRFRWLLRLQLPISSWIENKFERANLKLSQELKKQK